MSKKRFILSAGGTGGHVFPATAVAKELLSTSEVLFVASGLGRFFERELFSFREISSSTLGSKNPLKLFSQAYALLKGTIEASRILKQFKPDAVIGFGSYHTFPVLLAAKWHKVPIILHEQNAIPGKVNRLFAKHAELMGVTFPETKKFGGNNFIHVPFPLRESKRSSREEAASYFHLDLRRETILVFGGSQGAVALNRSFLSALQGLLQEAGSFQVLHFVGQRGSVADIAHVYQSLSIPAVVKPFESNMHFAWALADVAFVRAGAATISELIHSETPALLVPFPFASENHQESNAQHFIDGVGGGMMYYESELTGDIVSASLFRLLGKRHDLRRSIRRYKESLKLCSFTQHILGRDGSTVC